MPGCNMIEYTVQMDSVKYNKTSIRKIEASDTSLKSDDQQTRLTIYFKNPLVRRNIAVETYSFTDFFAICGGLLGLFLGVSFLSIVEIIYFVTLRLFWTIYQSRPKKAEKPFIDNLFNGIENSGCFVVIQTININISLCVGSQCSPNTVFFLLLALFLLFEIVNIKKISIVSLD